MVEKRIFSDDRAQIGNGDFHQGIPMGWWGAHSWAGYLTWCSASEWTLTRLTLGS